MAYLLRQTSPTAALQVSAESLLANTPFYFEFSVRTHTNVSNIGFFGRAGNSQVYCRTEANGQITFKFGSSNSTNRVYGSTLEPDTQYSFKVGRRGDGSLFIEKDGVLDAENINNSNSSSSYIDRILTTNSAGSGTLDLYYFKTILDGVTIRDYPADTMPSSGDTIFDQSSSENNATLVGFPTDDSQWVYYEESGGTIVEVVADVTLSEQTLSGITLTQRNTITPAVVQTTQTIDAVGLTATNNVAPDPLGQSQLLSTVVLTQENGLVPHGVSHSNSVTQPLLLQNGILTPNGITQGTTTTPLLLTQSGSLSVAEVTQESILNTVSLTASGQLPISQILSGQSTGAVTLSQEYVVNILAIANSHNIEGVVLKQDYNITVGSLVNSQQASIASIQQGYVVGVHSLTTEQSLQDITLLASGVLQVFGLDSSSILQEVGVLQRHLLSIDTVWQYQATIPPVGISQSQPTGSLLLVNPLANSNILHEVSLIQKTNILVDDINNQQSLGVGYFQEIPTLGRFFISFKPDTHGLNYSIDLIQIHFGDI